MGGGATPRPPPGMNRPAWSRRFWRCREGDGLNRVEALGTYGAVLITNTDAVYGTFSHILILEETAFAQLVSETLTVVGALADAIFPKSALISAGDYTTIQLSYGAVYAYRSSV